MLLNECETLTRGDQQIHLAGIDDAHFYRADDIEIAAAEITFLRSGGRLLINLSANGRRAVFAAP